MVPGIIMLQEKVCLLLWLASQILSLQLSHCHDVAVRVHGFLVQVPGNLEGSRTKSSFLSQDTLHITLPTDTCILNFFSGKEFSSVNVLQKNLQLLSSVIHLWFFGA